MHVAISELLFEHFHYTESALKVLFIYLAISLDFNFTKCYISHFIYVFWSFHVGVIFYVTQHLDILLRPEFWFGAHFRFLLAFWG